MRWYVSVKQFFSQHTSLAKYWTQIMVNFILTSDDMWMVPLRVETIPVNHFLWIIFAW